MANNRGVAYLQPGVVEVQNIDFPELALGNRQCHHGGATQGLVWKLGGPESVPVLDSAPAPGLRCRPASGTGRPSPLRSLSK